MSFKRQLIIFFLISVLGLGFDFGWPAGPAAASDLRGRILLQVEDKGQAWYVNPVDSQRYYLGRPDDAFNLMRALGLGVSNADLDAFRRQAPRRLAGRILLQVEDKGQAFYVNPATLQLHYLGRPADAFSLMRAQGLGITNKDLSIIPVFPSPTALAPAPAHAELARFSFRYRGRDYQIEQSFSPALYAAYQSSPKVYTYSSNNPPANLREAFYGLFLTIRAEDASLRQLASKLQALAREQKWTDDQLAEFALAFIQSIPYDSAKLDESGTANTNPYYPYETLYLNRGVCSDKTFLAVALLRELGFGAAILDFPERNHSAVGISCPVEHSLGGSGYCYGETTNYFPLGVIPQTISAGQAQAVTDYNHLFDPMSLGRIEIYQKSSGKSYGGIAQTKAGAAAIRTAKTRLAEEQNKIKELKRLADARQQAIADLKSILDEHYAAARWSEYNALIPQYNSQVREYNAGIAQYQAAIKDYNSQATALNAQIDALFN